MPWSQVYAPLGGIGVSALVAALPVVVLLALLAFWHVRAHLAAGVALLTAGVIAVAVYGMPAKLAVAAAGYGAAFGLLPIGWLVVNAIFIYQLSVETGQFVVLQQQIAGISRDRRIQALMIAFAFGAFIEGAAGFGAPVAISGGLMIGLGFKPLEAAKLALIGNTAPVAFGSLGIPLVTHGPAHRARSAPAQRDGRPPAAALLAHRPVLAGRRAGRLAAHDRGLAGLPHRRRHVRDHAVRHEQLPRPVARRHRERRRGDDRARGADAVLEARGGNDQRRARRSAAAAAATPLATGPAWKAWLPWIFLTGFVFVWGMNPVKNQLNAWFAPQIPVPALHLAVQKMPPVAPVPTLEKTIFNLNLLSATGTPLLLAGIASALCLGVGFRRALRIYGQTWLRVRVSLLTISAMMALGFMTRYGGTDTTMGLAMAGTGSLFPFFSPIIGWLGVALTGSDTASNVLFGNLQKVSAEALGYSPLLMCAANSSGGVMGKMIDAQSIVVAAVATGGRADSPDAGTVLRAVFWHSIALAALVGLLVYAQAKIYPFTEMVVR